MVRAITAAYDAGAEEAEVARWRRRVGGDVAMRALLEGTLDRLAFRLDDAERQYARAGTDHVHPAAAWAALGQAALLGQRGRFPETLVALDRARSLMREHGDRAGQADALLTQTLLTMRVIGIDSAAAVLRRIEPGALDEVPMLRARRDCVALQLRVRQGTRIADSTWQRVTQAAAAYGPRLGSECLFVRAQYVESLGKASDAVALLDSVARWQRAARAWNALSATRQWQGSTWLARGHYGLARAALAEALVLAQRSRSASGEAWATHELARVAQRLGAFNDAARLFATAQAGFLATGDRAGVTLAGRARAEAALRRGELGLADSLFRVLAADAQAVVPQLRVPALVARADIARRRVGPAASRLLLDSAAALADVHNLPGWHAEIRFHRGLVALDEGRTTAAIAQWDTLLRRHNPQGPARFEVTARWAEALARAGDLEAAWRRFGLAGRAIDRWASGFKRREDVLAALQDRNFDWDRDLGLATMIARFAHGGRVPEALAMAEWRRVRAKEQLALQRGALAMDALGTVRVAAPPADTNALDPQRYPALAHARLDSTEAVVSYIVGHGQEPTTAFVLTRDTLVSVALVTIDSLLPRLEPFSAFLQAGRYPAPLADELGAALVHPVLAVLPTRVRRLVIVPDGELHRLPFAALQHPNGAPLGAEMALAVAPSVDDALGSVVRPARPAPGGARAHSLLVGAPARMPIDPVTGVAWEPLPGARREVTRLAALLADVDVLAGPQVTRTALLPRLVRGGPLLHVATHAVADVGSFERNGLVVQPAGTDRGLLDVATLAAQPLGFDLVVLSACASADGVLFGGQALHGLVSAALDAGARGVVATRWRLDDAAIVPYMVRLHERLLAGDDVVSAVHHVRRAAIHEGASPAVWATLDYFGDPTLRVALAPRAPSLWERMGRTLRRWLWPGGRGQQAELAAAGASVGQRDRHPPSVHARTLAHGEVNR